jgi:oligopeptide transport system ATP-binding protein
MTATDKTAGNELRVEGLHVWAPSAAGPVLIVDGVDLAVKGGTVHGIAGESGSGKSISMQSLIGLQASGMVRQGKITLHGRDVSALSDSEQRQIRGSQVGMIFQDPMTSLHPMLTIGKQLTEHMRRSLDIGKDEANKRAVDLLQEVRIPNPKWSMKAYPHQFSGGMRQRVAIAMALACEPTVLIADEPTTALDVTVQAGILRLLRRLCETHDLAVILITHDLGVMAAVADELTVMYAGRIVESGPTATVLQTARHPYTDLLVKSLPKAYSNEEGGQLLSIDGDPATPQNRPPGCAFHPRCPFAEASCAVDVPPLIQLGSDHFFACPVDPLREREQA